VSGGIQDMTPAERFRAAVVIMRDAVEKQDAERAQRDARSEPMAVAS